MDIKNIVAVLIIIVLVAWITVCLYQATNKDSLDKFLKRNTVQKKRSGPIWWFRK